MGAPSGQDTLIAFPLAAGMASLAGATDAYGLSFLRDLFVSFMSGNTTSLGVALGQGDWARAWLILGIVGLFVAGAAAGAILGEVSGRHHRAAVILAVALALATPLLAPHWAIAAFVLAMGALNASMNRVGETSISLTYVTGTLVKFGQGIGRTLCGKPGGVVLGLASADVGKPAGRRRGRDPGSAAPRRRGAMALACLRAGAGHRRPGSRTRWPSRQCQGIRQARGRSWRSIIDPGRQRRVCRRARI